MRIDRIRARGFGPFDAEFDIDLKAIGGPLVAVTGPNGSGKSTFLELLAGALYRECPTRGKLTKLATGRDAFLEVDVVNGEAWRIRQTVDSQSGKGEALVTDSDGVPVLPDTKVRSFDEWAATHLPAPSVLYSSTFAVQGGGSAFHVLKPADRKAVLLRVLGIEHLEKLAELARERARDAKQAHAIAEARRADELERGGNVEQAETAHLDALEAHEAATLALTGELEALDRAKENNAEADRIEAEQANRADLVAELIRLDERLETDRKLASEADAIRAGAASYREYGGVSETAVERWREAGEGSRRAADALADHDASMQRADSELSDALRELEKLDALLKDPDGIEEANTRRQSIAVQIEDARGNLDAHRELVEGSADRRVVSLREFLSEIAKGADSPGAIAGQALAADDVEITKAGKAPERVAAYAKELRGLQAMFANSELLDLAGRWSEIVGAKAERKSTAKAHARAAESLNEWEEKRLVLAVAYKDRSQELTGRDNARAKAAEILASYEPEAKLEAQLDQAEARLGEADRARDDLERRIGDLPGVESLAPIYLAPLERGVARAQGERRQTERAVATAESAVEQAADSAGRLEQLELALGSIVMDLADWQRLAADLGRDGLQALEIDAAGPALTALVNELLHSCVSDRWSVSIETTRLSADGKRQLEGLDIMVIDTVAGRDAPIETYSGGERVILGEAIALALTITACNRSGIRGATLVRDESGAALDPANGRAYLAMLRRAAELTGAAQVLFVSHSPELQELADARIHIADGRVEVRP